MEYKLTLQHFDITMTKTDEMLLLEAEDNLTGHTFSKILNEESVKSLTSDHSLDIDTVFQLIKDFIQNKPDKVSVTLNNEGKLAYSCQAMFGTVSRHFGFGINLDKQAVDPVVKLEKLLNKLTNRVAELEKGSHGQGNPMNNENFEKFVKTNNEQYKALEKLVLQKFEKLENTLAKIDERVRQLESKPEKSEKIEAKKCVEKEDVDVLHYEGRFNPSCDFASKYTLTNGNRTALAKTGQFHTIFADKSLAKSKKTRFTVHIEKEHNLLVGIAPHTALRDNSWPNYPATFGYRDADGFIHREQKQVDEGLPKYFKGDKISFLVDMETGNVCISLNDKVVYNYTIPKGYIAANQFYPFISTNASAGVGVTFI